MRKRFLLIIAGEILLFFYPTWPMLFAVALMSLAITASAFPKGELRTAY